MTNVTTLAQMARRSVNVRGNTPSITVGHRVAGNDPTLGEPADSRREIDAWARRARGASGFGDAGIVDSTPSAWPSSYELYQAARTHRAFVLGEMMASAVRSVRALVYRAYKSYKDRRQQSAVYETLSQLDDRTLRDLGFDRSEIRSVAAEWAGQAEPTRMRVVSTQGGSSAVV